MKSWIKYCLLNPVVVFVCSVFLVLFGLMALDKMPYQLLPQISRPVISVYTSWKGAPPYEIEKEITDKQEKYLKNIPGLLSLTSNSRQGMSSITLEFDINTDMKTALLNVSSKLDEVRGYPSDVSKPIIKTTGENVPISIYLFAKTLDVNEDINHYKSYIADDIIKYYERIDGVGEVYVSGGVNEQVFITLDTQKLAFYHITIDEVISSIKKQNLNISAGNMDFAQRNYRISTIGEYDSLDSIGNTVIKTIHNKNIILKDLAIIHQGYEKTSSYNFHNNNQTISIQIRPTASASILELTNKVEETTKFLNENFLEKRGLVIDWGRDQRQYILSSIKLVKENILLGIALAIIVLFLFLRKITPLVVVILAIPLSIIGSFVLLGAFDRTLNVILLAGVSFAISMIIDSAIVVLENILRHTKIQKDHLKACIVGTYEVTGALFASTITTLAIFIPIIFLKDDAGKLFVDIAIAASSSIGISLIVCLFMIPTFLYVVLKRLKIKDTKGSLSILVERFGEKITKIIMNCVIYCTKTTIRQISSVLIFVGLCGFFSFIAFPKTDYLPKGNQNFIIAYLTTPSGLSLEEKEHIVKILRSKFQPFLTTNPNHIDNDEVPLVKDFFVSAGESIYFYLVANDPKRIKDLMAYAQESIDSIPNLRGVVLQQEIFSGASSSSIDINISGSDLNSLSTSAHNIIELIKEKIPNLSIRVIPSLDANNQEINLYPDNRSLALNGLNMQSFGTITEVMLKGKNVGDYRENGKILDLILDSKQAIKDRQTSPEDILYSQIYTPNGGIVLIGSLAVIKNEYGVSRIRHFEQKRNLLLIINTKDDTPIEKVADILQQEIIKPLAKNDKNDITISGSAGKLQKLKAELFNGFILAIIITYLILCALYGNFLYPFIIILTVPLATTGGLLGLFLVDKFIAKQNLDVLTMLGFIILVGSVVNNAILIVYQTLINIKQYHQENKEAILNATQSRLSPIYMSMFTSVLALIPLVLFAGDGSEIYRGLGAVLIGGIIFSTFITILIIPALLMLSTKTKK
ncbi:MULTISPECIES: efflux RND transporter permease subunit [unclassified Helicobacter]|uniref:efflux RND transporter permease subunit n=1 Tax=unclassified Helicobacter TaxID=2593540 RepID=UPI000CF1298A|nr:MULTISPECIES: efflux RND transporter permease subunit [unclassified Helicobacter]